MRFKREGIWGDFTGKAKEKESVAVESPDGIADGDGTPVVEVTKESKDPTVTDLLDKLEVKPKKLKKREPEVTIEKPRSEEPEIYINFEDLDILEPPFVEEFKRDFGRFPTLRVMKFCKLPLRYDVGGGRKRFKMATFESGTEIKVTGVEAGKKVEWNILCKYRGDELVLEPSMILKFFKVLNPHHSSFKLGKPEPEKEAAEMEWPEKPVTVEKRKITEERPKRGVVSEKLKTVIEQRKKEARFKI